MNKQNISSEGKYNSGEQQQLERRAVVIINMADMKWMYARNRTYDNISRRAEAATARFSCYKVQGFPPTVSLLLLIHQSSYLGCSSGIKLRPAVVFLFFLSRVFLFASVLNYSRYACRKAPSASDSRLASPLSPEY